jgi:CRP-like cAMP-binding protein
MDHSVGTLSDCTVAYMPHEKLRAVIGKFPNLGYVMWRDTLVESAIFRAWLMGVGRKSALSRVAHFFCEQFMRMEAVGLNDGPRVTLAITQNDIADCLGLSQVHANRTLQALRHKGLIELRSKMLTIVKWEELKVLGEFNPTYLHFIRA